MTNKSNPVEEENEGQGAVNTDREIYRQPTKEWTNEDGDDRGMEPTVFVTQGGGIGFNHYGTCVVRTIKEWVRLATHASEERKASLAESRRALAEKVREAVSKTWDKMSNRLFDHTMMGKNTAFDVTSEDWNRGSFTKEEFVDQVLSMLEGGK